MKRFLAVLLSVLMLGSVMAMQVSAGSGGASLGDVKYVQTGTIQIDGVMDEAYAKSLSVAIDLLSADTSSSRANHATGKAWLLWNEGGIYVFVEIHDPTPTTPPSMAGLPMDGPLGPEYFIWNRDALEVFFEPTNSDSRAETYATHLCVDNAAYIYAGAYQDGDESDFWACLKVNGAEKEDMDYFVRVDPNDKKIYYVEMFFRLPGFSYKAGDKVGIMFQIDDMEKAIEDFSNGEDRAVVVNRSSAGDSVVVWDIPNHDYIVLSAEDATPPPPPPPPPPAVEEEAPTAAPETPATVPAAPAPDTGDTGLMVLFALAALSSAATFRAVQMEKKKRTTQK